MQDHLVKNVEISDNFTYPTFDQMQSLLIDAFKQANDMVYNDLPDVKFSGSTCVSILTYGRKVFISNVGDSRAILVQQNSVHGQPSK